MHVWIFLGLLGASTLLLCVGIVIGVVLKPTAARPTAMIATGLPVAITGVVFAGLSYLFYVLLIGGLLIVGVGIGKLIAGKRRGRFV